MFFRIKTYIEEHCPRFILQPLMKRRYRQRASAAVRETTEETFTRIYRSNFWGSTESVSGKGSDLDRAQRVMRELPVLIKDLGVKSILDAPCGDFNWMQYVNLGNCQYFGGDIVYDLVERNRSEYGSEARLFIHLDITKDNFPRVDLLLCRDCLIHLSFDLIQRALNNIRRSGIKYLLTTTYPQKKRNWDIDVGGFRPINLQAVPFNLPPPIQLIHEDVSPVNPSYERNLGLWTVDKM